MIHPDQRPILGKLDHWGKVHDDHTRDYAEAVEASADIDVAYELGFARALVRAKGSNAEVRKAEALIACEDVYTAKVRSDARLASLKAQLKNADKQVERCRSWNSAASSSAREGGAPR